MCADLLINLEFNFVFCSIVCTAIMFVSGRFLF